MVSQRKSPIEAFPGYRSKTNLRLCNCDLTSALAVYFFFMDAVNVFMLVAVVEPIKKG